MKVLLVEDEKKAREVLSRGFHEQGWEVVSAANGRVALDTLEQNQFDVIVTDILMPELDGIELIKHLREKEIYTPILLLTALEDTKDKVRGLNEGADDYLEKPYAFEELVARIKALYRRSSPKTKGLTLTYGDLTVNLETEEVSRAGQPINLTPKEFALTKYFVENRERLISKAEIAHKVWDINFDTNTNIIEVYINYLRKKIDRPFDTTLIHTQHGKGYIFRFME